MAPRTGVLSDEHTHAALNAIMLYCPSYTIFRETRTSGHSHNSEDAWKPVNSTFVSFLQEYRPGQRSAFAKDTYTYRYPSQLLWMASRKHQLFPFPVKRTICHR